MGRVNKRKQKQLICPACGEIVVWSMMYVHFQDGRDDAHINLESKVETYTTDAHCEAEQTILDLLCEEAQ